MTSREPDTCAIVTWTSEELKRFDDLVDDHSSANQLTRISARLALRRFMAEHGKEKCDAMFAHSEALRNKKAKR